MLKSIALGTTVALSLAMAGPALSQSRQPAAAAQAPSPARVNPVIKLLEAGKPVFSIWANYAGIGTDNWAATTLQDTSNFDFIFLDMEHNPFDSKGLGVFLQEMINPAQVAKNGISATKPVLVRIPPNGREIHMNQWAVKQALDAGAGGIVFPHIETPEQAIAAISAVRYPQPANAPHVLPEGLRGLGSTRAPRYWGLSGLEYEKHSDVWGLNPDAELLVVFIIENKFGVEKVRDIARAMKEANAKVILWAGGGDLSLSYGHDAAATEAGLQKILAAGKEFGLPVGMNGTADFKERYAQGFQLFFDAGAQFYGTGPKLTPEQRRAVGR